MRPPEEKKVSIETFYQMREETSNLLEYVDGIILMSPSSSTKHQQVSARLQAKLSVICDLEGLEENKFVGVPELIVEILAHPIKPRARYKNGKLT
jgi:Uma2 family endonuclease